MISKSGRCIAISRLDFFSVGNENVDMAFRTEGRVDMTPGHLSI